MREHIVILGGGFGGWYAARALAPRLRSGHRITLVDRVDHMLYTPMLTEVAGGTLAPGSIAVPTASLSRRVRIVRAEVQGVDVAKKLVTLGNGEVLEATQLVFALGSTTAYHSIEGAEEHSVPLKTLQNAEDVLSRVNALVAQASRCTDADERRRLLTVVVAGGGYTGVETIAAVAERLRVSALQAGINENEVSSVLIEPSSRLMHETPEQLAAYSQRFLEHRGIRVMLNVGVKSVDGDTISLTEGDPIKTGLLIWDTGIEPSPLLQKIGLPLGKHHGVVVDATFAVQGLRGIWAIGDCAEIPQPGGGFYAATAQNATREGVHLAKNISAVLRGEAPLAFRFNMLGQLALLSNQRAVAEILGIQIRGLLAWSLWWAIYIAKLPSTPRRLAVAKQLVSSLEANS